LSLVILLIITDFDAVRVALLTHFSFLCCVVLSLSSSCVLYVQCCQCLWTDHSRLPLWFSVTYIYLLLFNNYFVNAKIWRSLPTKYRIAFTKKDIACFEIIKYCLHDQNLFPLLRYAYIPCVHWFVHPCYKLLLTDNLVLIDYIVDNFYLIAVAWQLLLLYCF